MGMNMYLFGVKRKYDDSKRINEKYYEKMTLSQVGYWRKAWIIFYWFIKKMYGGNERNVECLLATFDDYILEDLVKDCKDTIKYCDKYEAAHRAGTVKETIPDNCLLGSVWDYLFYNRYELSGYIAELEYTINLCEELLKEDEFEEYVLELSP